MSTRAGSGDPFVGRRAELAAFDDAWSEARGGAPRLVWVEGEAGSGKSALIARCVAACDGVVLSASGDESETGLAYGLLDQLAAGVPDAVAEQFGLVAPDRDPRADPLAVGSDLLGALGALPGDEPVLVVVDDVQWADPPSVRALLFVLRRLRHDRVVVLVGARTPGDGPGEPEPDTRWERMLGPGRGVRRLRLGGLPPAELSELAAALGNPLGSIGAAERLWRHTGGHPLHARALIEELPREVLAGAADVLPAPRSLTAVVLARLARATPATEALVVAASVLGVSCTLGQAAAVAGLDEPAAALDEAVRLGMLHERPGPAPRRIGFVHPLLRAAVHGDLAPARRRALHAAAAALLPGRDGLAHRVAAAAGADPGLAAELEALACDRAAALPGPEAADLLRAAADLSLVPADRERRTLAAVQRLVDDGEIARARALEPLVEQCPPGPERDEMLGQLALLSGRFDRARGWLEARDGPSGHLALLRILEGDAAQALGIGGAALAAAGPRPAERMPAGFAVVVGLAATGRGADADAVLDRAAAAAGGGRTPPDVLVMRGVLAALGGDDASAAAVLDDAVRRARSGEPIRSLAFALTFLAASQERLGEPGAPDGLELAVAVARDGGNLLPGTLARAYAAEALALRGRGDDARGHLADTSGPRWWGGEVCVAVAAAALAEVDDDPDGVLRALEPALRPPVRALTEGLGLLAPRVLEAGALIALGRTADAGTALDALDGLVAGRPSSRYRIDAARLRVALASATGRVVPDTPPPGPPADAAPLATARLETELGHHLMLTGERRAGVDLVRAARERCARLGAAPFHARCDALLHGAGLTPPAEDDALGLTPHEQAVVALVARGLTNREVARDLFVTQRTVAYHLSNVYAKLGVTSRRALRGLVTAGR